MVETVLLTSNDAGRVIYRRTTGTSRGKTKSKDLYCDANDSDVVRKYGFTYIRKSPEYSGCCFTFGFSETGITFSVIAGAVADFVWSCLRSRTSRLAATCVLVMTLTFIERRLFASSMHHSQLHSAKRVLFLPVDLKIHVDFAAPF
jgi:hypothetical protein